MNDAIRIACWTIALVGMLCLVLIEGLGVLYENPLACVGMALVGLGLCKEGQRQVDTC